MKTVVALILMLGLVACVHSVNSSPKSMLDSKLEARLQAIRIRLEILESEMALLQATPRESDPPASF